MKKIFNDSLFAETMDNDNHSGKCLSTTDEIVEQISHDEYVRQRNRVIKYMYKHDFSIEELCDTYKMTEEEIRIILEL